MVRFDFINEDMQKEHHAVQTFEDVGQAMKQHYYITGKQLDPLPSPDQQNKELVFIALRMTAAGFGTSKMHLSP